MLGFLGSPKGIKKVKNDGEVVFSWKQLTKYVYELSNIEGITMEYMDACVECQVYSTIIQYGRKMSANSVIYIDLDTGDYVIKG